MKIHDDHMFHGAALIQIAEHPQFTAINSLKINGASYSNAYRINDDISVYLKYGSNPNKSFREYQFTFSQAHLTELGVIAQANHKTFLALVCVKGREICCLKYQQLLSLIDQRKKAAGKQESQYVVLVTIPKNSSMHVYINAPGQKKRSLARTSL
jgi:hypothetical protein